MIRALFYLRLTSLKNLLLSRLRRLKQPKYLLGGAAGAAYFWFFFFRHIFGKSGHHAAMPPIADTFPLLPNDSWPLVGSLGALLLLGIVSLVWIFPSQKVGLGFTEAEIAFLFPAPASRRMLINFKLLGSQFTILFTALFFTLISNRWSFLGGNALTHALGWWIILSTLNLHFAAAALTLTRLFDRGIGTLRRRVIGFGVLALLVAGTVAWVWQDLQAPSANDPADPTAFSHYLLIVLNGGALGWLLWPFRLVLAPFLAPDGQAFLLAIGPALLLMAAHYFWVMRLHEASFEEASIASAEKRTARIAQAKAGRYQFGVEKAKARRGPFHLRDVGRPEVAFLWKNLLSTRPYFNLRSFAICAAILVVGSRWIPRGSIPVEVQLLFLGMSLFYLLMLGPHIARQDLRSDLANTDVLKTYPIPGWRLVLGEILTPTAILTGLIWLVLLSFALFFTPPVKIAKSFTPGLQTTSAVCVAIVTPALIALQLLVLNAATVVFPGWFQTSRMQGGGIEVMGQRLIFVFGNLLVVLGALLPSAAAAGAVLLACYGIRTALHFFGGTAPAFFPALSFTAAFLAVFAILIGEVWLGLRWLGRRFEKFDLSAELRP